MFQNLKNHRFIVHLRASPLVVLLVVQGMMVALFWFLSSRGLATAWLESSGYARFASDSLACHEQAVEMSLWVLDPSEWLRWWQIDSRFHTRLASVSYAFWGPWLGYGIQSFWMINALALLLMVGGMSSLSKALWALLEGSSSSMKSEHKTADHKRHHGAVWCLLMLPSVLLHSTQLLRDPFYMAFQLWWLSYWLRFLSCREHLAFLKHCFPFLVVSTLLWASRERFWVLAQVMSLGIWLGAIVLVVGGLRPKKCLLWVSFVILLFHAGSLQRAYQRWSGFALEQNIEQQDSHGAIQAKAFRYFYKVARLRHDFNKSYDQASNLDTHVDFASDAEVLAYVPRAIALGFLSPFPTAWFEEGGKTGVWGRRVAAFEMCFMMLVMLQVLWYVLRGVGAWGLLLPMWAILAQCVALGLVISNGGALYRMRYSAWLLLLVCWWFLRCRARLKSR